MTELERHLRETLKRTEPPAGFAERVAQSAYRSASPLVRISWWGRPALRAAAAFLVVVLGASAWGSYRIQERKRGEAAAADLILALEITSGKMNLVKKTLNDPPALAPTGWRNP